MNKILVICGPTATGKTSLAVELAKIFKGEILSADSRQVYKKMNIGTGKDLPQNAKPRVLNKKLPCFYEIEKIRIWGYDLVAPDREFSLADYVPIGQDVIKNIWKRGKLPIVVGGSGLYIKATIEGVETINVPKNEELRLKLNTHTPQELFEQLEKIDSRKANSLNQSDRKNPRRLIRAIEIATFFSNFKKTSTFDSIDNLRAKQPFMGFSESDVLYIGLKLDKKYLNQKIAKRVQERMRAGFEKEADKLFEKGIDYKKQSMQSLGYKQYRECLENDFKQEHFVNLWIKKETQYAKRQMTWFKKNEKIKWFDIKKQGCLKAMEKEIKEWYSSSRTYDKKS